MDNLLSNNQDYQNLLAQVKTQIQQSQSKAAISVNQEMLILYWHIGRRILERQEEKGWGAKVVEQLSKDLKKSFPDMKGFSKRNLLYMKQFAETYPKLDFVQASLAQISWYHNITLLQKVSNEQERLWYAQGALKNAWSRNAMVRQIELKLYERQGKALSNFERNLPAPQSELAQQVLKDPYVLDFLGLEEEFLEREMEDAIVHHITKYTVN